MPSANSPPFRTTLCLHLVQTNSSSSDRVSSTQTSMHWARSSKPHTKITLQAPNIAWQLPLILHIGSNQTKIFKANIVGSHCFTPPWLLPAQLAASKKDTPQATWLLMLVTNYSSYMHACHRYMESLQFVQQILCSLTCILWTGVPIHCRLVPCTHTHNKLLLFF